MLPLEPNRSGFNWSTARACAERCALAYTATPRSLADLGVKAQTVWNTATDTQALVFDESDYICVAFRGSCALRDWLQNFKVQKEHPRVEIAWTNGDAGAVEVHRGFMEDVDSVSENLSHTIGNLVQQRVAGGTPAPLKESVPIFVTGHSKGGAEAILFALELERLGYFVRAVYTFGQPRVGNKSFADFYNATLFEETYRVVNQNDIVPRLPCVLMGYRHSGQEIFLPVGGGWERNPMLVTKLCSDALGLWGAYRHETDVLVMDHLLSAYQKRIQLLI